MDSDPLSVASSSVDAVLPVMASDGATVGSDLFKYPLMVTSTASFHSRVWGRTLVKISKSTIVKRKYNIISASKHIELHLGTVLSVHHDIKIN